MAAFDKYAKENSSKLDISSVTAALNSPDVLKASLPEKENFFEKYLQFVFDPEYFRWCTGYDLNKLREDTSLQRKMKQFVLNGGKPSVGMGYLNLKKALE